MTSPIVRGPRGVADLRLWLADRWKPGGPFDKAFHRMKNLGYEEASDLYSKTFSDELSDLTRAQLWWVSTEMVEVLETAAWSIPDETEVGELTIPSPQGLVVFDKSIMSRVIDEDGSRTHTCALVWNAFSRVKHPTEDREVSCVAVTVYEMVDFDAGLRPNELEAVMRVGAWYENVIEVGMGRDEIGRRTASIHGQTWIPLRRSAWMRDQAVTDWPWDDDHGGSGGANAELHYGDSSAPRQYFDNEGQPTFGPEDHYFHAFDDRRILAALFTLLTQPGIADKEVESFDRSTVRRAKRVGIKDDSAGVQVIRLRRPSGSHDHGDGEPTRYSHRWIVDGHWRRQPCGVGKKDRRLIYIAPHVKGPDDKPLKDVTKIRALVR